MGEAKRRKTILGDLYGKPTSRPTSESSRAIASDPNKNYRIELGTIISAHEPGMAQIAAEASRQGIINNGTTIPFVVKINSGGELVDFGFPSAEGKSIRIGLVVLKVTNITVEEATPIYRSAENELRRRVALAFKEITLSDALLLAMK